MNETNAVSALGIIMNPQSGEILAMASVPGLIIITFRSTTKELHKIRAITDQFEPGSTFKIVPAMATTSLEHYVKNEFNCENGAYQYYVYSVTDHEKRQILIPQIIQYSWHIGIAK